MRTRKLGLLVSAGMAVLAAFLGLASATQAAPPTPTPVKPPDIPRPMPTGGTPQLQNRGVVVTGFRSVSTGVVVNGPSGPMEATSTAAVGASKYEVEVTNSTGAAVTTNLVVTKTDGYTGSGVVLSPFSQTLPVSLAKGASTKVSFVDPRGMPDGCTVVAYELRLADKVQRARATPSCAFNISSSGAASSPQSAGFLHYERTQLRSTPKCNEKLDVAAEVVNATTDATSAKLSLAFPGNTPSYGVAQSNNRYAESPATFLSNGASKNHFTTEHAVFHGDVGDYLLSVRHVPYTLEAQTRTSNAPVAAPTWTMKVTRTCGLPNTVLLP